MASSSIERARILALRAHAYLSTARLMLALALDGAPAEPLAAQLRSIEAELIAAQEAVQAIVGMQP